MTRRVPSAIARSWDQLPAESPVEALASSHALHRAVAEWQASLVKEAVEQGASWEEIGSALGTTRQAAWARFRVALESSGGRKGMQGREQIKRHLKQLWESGHARRREMESKWREEERRLRDEVAAARNHLNTERQRHATERKEARENLRQEMKAARRTE